MFSMMPAYVAPFALEFHPGTRIHEFVCRRIDLRTKIECDRFGGRDLRRFPKDTPSKEPTTLESCTSAGKEKGMRGDLGQ